MTPMTYMNSQSFSFSFTAMLTCSVWLTWH